VVFVQVIQGQVADASKVRAAFDRWAQELALGAIGWLGSTAGVTEDGRFIALARFQSQEAARANADFHAGCSAQPSAVMLGRAVGPSMA
jgi:hypothetical protein